jgi:hypothetical protein
MPKSTRAPASKPPQDEPPQEEEGGRLAIAPEASSWSNAGTAANAHEARAVQGSREHTGHEGMNAASPARTFEAKIAQEGSH